MRSHLGDGHSNTVTHFKEDEEKRKSDTDKQANTTRKRAAKLDQQMQHTHTACMLQGTELSNGMCTGKCILYAMMSSA